MNKTMRAVTVAIAALLVLVFGSLVTVASATAAPAKIAIDAESTRG